MIVLNIFKTHFVIKYILLIFKKLILIHDLYKKFYIIIESLITIYEIFLSNRCENQIFLLI